MALKHSYLHLSTRIQFRNYIWYNSIPFGYHLLPFHGLLSLLTRLPLKAANEFSRHKDGLGRRGPVIVDYFLFLWDKWENVVCNSLWLQLRTEREQLCTLSGSSSTHCEKKFHTQRASLANIQEHQGVANWTLESDPPMINMLTKSANIFADGQQNFRPTFADAADYFHGPKWTTIVWAELERSTEVSGGVFERAHAIVVWPDLSICSFHVSGNPIKHVSLYLWVTCGALTTPWNFNTHKPYCTSSCLLTSYLWSMDITVLAYCSGNYYWHPNSHNISRL